jgi:hypothetical protein
MQHGQHQGCQDAVPARPAMAPPQQPAQPTHGQPSSHPQQEQTSLQQCTAPDLPCARSRGLHKPLAPLLLIQAQTNDAAITANDVLGCREHSKYTSAAHVGHH